MNNWIFMAMLVFILGSVFVWGFRHLPQEGWQVFAVIPAHKSPSGTWNGLNLTFYGIFNALAYTVAVTVLILLLETAGISRIAWMSLIVSISLICLPAAKIIARIIENKPNTFTVAGASFVGILFAPILVLVINRIAEGFGRGGLPLIPVMAALSIAYCIGEGIGRLACISFGCCYGKPIDRCPSWVQRIFGPFCFVFTGKIKKIAYAHRLDGHKVLPIQAISSVVLTSTGCLSMMFFLEGAFSEALLIAVCVEKLWRWISEFFRADFRGVGSISAYQWLSLCAIPLVICIVLSAPVHGVETGPLDISVGLNALWSPQALLFLEGIALAIFLYTGRSRVTGSRLEFFVYSDRI